MDKGTTFILGLLAGYVLFTEQGKSIVKTVTNTAMSSVTPIPSVINTLANSVNGTKEVVANDKH